MSSVPVQQPTSVHTVAEAAAGLDFTSAPSLPVAVLISGGGTLDFVDNKGGVTTGAVLVAGQPYPWTIAQVTGCTGSGQVQFFFDLSAYQKIFTTGAALQAEVTTLQGQVSTLTAGLISLDDGLAALTDTVGGQGVDIDSLKAVAGVGAIYQPGTVPGVNRFDTILGAISALRPFGGGDVVIDTRFGAATTEIGDLDITGIRFVGLDFNTPVLTIVEGTTFTSDYSQFNASNVAIQWTGASSPFALTAGASLGVTLEDYASITTTAAATGPFFDVGSGCTLYVDVGYQCTIGKDPAGNALVDMASAPGTSCTINMLTGSILQQDTLTGGGDGDYLVVDRTAGLTANGGAATISHTQTGTTNVVYQP